MNVSLVILDNCEGMKMYLPDNFWSAFMHRIYSSTYFIYNFGITFSMMIVKSSMSDDLEAPSSSSYFKSSFRRLVPLFAL